MSLRRQQRKRQKSNRFRLANQQLSTARAPRFFVHFVAVNARLRLLKLINNS